MLVISRGAGESIQIGQSTVLVERLYPVVVLVLIEDGVEKKVEFAINASFPAVELKQGRVLLERIQRRKLLLIVDAPRDVPVLRTELRRDAAP